jgi:hypothetical protein
MPTFNEQTSVEDSGTVCSSSDKESMTTSAPQHSTVSDPIQDQSLPAGTDNGLGSDDMPVKTEPVLMERPKRVRTKKT